MTRKRGLQRKEGGAGEGNGGRGGEQHIFRLRTRASQCILKRVKKPREKTDHCSHMIHNLMLQKGVRDKEIYTSFRSSHIVFLNHTIL